jgi:hypothetical protein
LKEKPHECCQICQKRFSRKNILKKHTTEVHLKEKPLEFNVCHQKAHHSRPPEREASYRDVKSTSQQSTSKRSHMSVKFAKRDFHGKAFSTSTPQKST